MKKLTMIALAAFALSSTAFAAEVSIGTTMAPTMITGCGLHGGCKVQDAQIVGNQALEFLKSGQKGAELNQIMMEYRARNAGIEISDGALAGQIAEEAFGIIKGQ